FAKPRSADCLEDFVRRKRRGREVVRDPDQLVWIGALVAVAAHCGCDGPDRDSGVAIEAARDGAQAVRGRRPREAGRWVVAGGVVIDGVRYAETQSGREHIDLLPGTETRVENPLLQSGGRLRRGVRIGAAPGIKGIAAVAFVGHISRGRIGEPDTEWE